MSVSEDISKALKKSYGRIAADFSASRSAAWPEFSQYLEWIPEDSKVLDLGCGNGRFYAFLQKEERRIDYTGVDFCPELLEIARKRYPKQDFVEQDMTELDLERHFDVVVSIAAFHHLPTLKLRQQCLEKIFDHLEDDGTLMLSAWNLWQRRYLKIHLKAWWKWLSSGFSWSPRDLMVPFGKDAVERYYHAFTSRELHGLLKEAGFQIEESRVSRHNYVLICRKKVAVAPGNPLFVKKKAFPEPLAPHHA